MEMPFFGQYNVGAPSFGQYAMFMESIGFLPFDITEMHSMPDPLEKGTHVITQVDMLFVRAQHVQHHPAMGACAQYDGGVEA